MRALMRPKSRPRIWSLRSVHTSLCMLALCEGQLLTWGCKIQSPRSILKKLSIEQNFPWKLLKSRQRRCGNPSSFPVKLTIEMKNAYSDDSRGSKVRFYLENIQQIRRNVHLKIAPLRCHVSIVGVFHRRWVNLKAFMEIDLVTR